MLTLNLNTLPRDAAQLEQALAAIRGKAPPSFASYTPDFQLLYMMAGKYASTTNFIIIGRDGGALGFKALFSALAKYHTTKRVSILDTLDSDYIEHIRRKFRPDDTTVILISMRGDDPVAIQGLLAFQEYKKIIIAGEGPLSQYATTKEIDFIRYPAMSCQYSFGTEAVLLPAAIIYVDAKSIVNGMHAVYRQCEPGKPYEQNPALQLAAALVLAARQGKSQVVVRSYVKALGGAATLLTKLLESPEESCSFVEPVGQSRFASHELILFLRVEHPTNECVLGTDYQIGVQGITSFSGAHLGEAMTKIYQDDRKAADEAKILNGTITLDVLNPGTLGELIGFWQYLSLYGAWLRGLES